MSNTELQDALKSKKNFEDYLTQNFPPEITRTIGEYPKAIGQNVVLLAELTQNIETFLDTFGVENLNTKQSFVWVVTAPKDRIINALNFVNNSLNLFIFKACLNGDKMDFECLLKPTIQVKRTKNENTPAKMLQKEIWEKYIEICDLSEHPDLQIKEALPRHYQPISINKPGIQLMQTINTQEGYVASELLISNKKSSFDKLFEQKEEIESVTGELEWDSKEGNKSAKIRKTYPIDISNSDNHQLAIEQQIKMGAELKEVAHKYL